jgi:hypothetical protein
VICVNLRHLRSFGWLCRHSAFIILPSAFSAQGPTTTSESAAAPIGLKEQQHETMLDAMAARLKPPFLPELTVQDGQIMFVS